MLLDFTFEAGLNAKRAPSPTKVTYNGGVREKEFLMWAEGGLFFGPHVNTNVWFRSEFRLRNCSRKRVLPFDERKRDGVPTQAKIFREIKKDNGGNVQKRGRDENGLCLMDQVAWREVMAHYVP